MSAHHGNEGNVQLGANAVAEVQSWDYEEEDVDVQDVASMGDTEVTHFLSGIKRGSGSIECLWDETDTNGQETLDVGASVTLNLYPEGDASTDVYFGGTAKITNVRRGASVRGMVTVSFSFVGVLAQQTVV